MGTVIKGINVLLRFLKKNRIMKVTSKTATKPIATVKLKTVDNKVIEMQGEGAGSVDEWLSWGDNLGLDAEYDNDRQLIFYTMDPMEAREAETMGAEIEKDSSGLMVIYTGAMK